MSRSGVRPHLAARERTSKAEVLPVSGQNLARGVTESVQAADPRAIAIGMLANYGWTSGEFSCLDQLYAHESAWDPHAKNPSSGAYGIPQSLPADKMAAYGDDWQTNPATQLGWGLDYIDKSYGSPCGAWAFWQSNNWY
ncbi:MAG: hypothetical protein WKF82_11170 [Nocardioidaceae bacterium]